LKLNTFKLILRFTYASDSDSEPKRGSAGYDPQYKFRQVLEHLNATGTQDYNLHRDVSIDKTIIWFQSETCFGKLYQNQKNTISGGQKSTTLLIRKLVMFIRQCITQLERRKANLANPMMCVPNF
jgi:hypothetical protein